MVTVPIGKAHVPWYPSAFQTEAVTFPTEQVNCTIFPLPARLTTITRQLSAVAATPSLQPASTIPS
eukprot:m.206713 g.206713  ORF g.206713 m.206713 type:complete len:66 (+) comp10122_c0_seq3:2056-2253(+)